MKYKTTLIAYKLIVAQRIKLHRTLLNLSQADLALKANLSQATIAHLESGRKLPSLNTLILLSHTFDISPQILLTQVPNSILRGTV